MYALINVWQFEKLNFENNHTWNFLPKFKGLILSIYYLCMKILMNQVVSNALLLQDHHNFSDSSFE